MPGRWNGRSSDTPVPWTKNIHKQLGKRIDHREIGDKFGVGFSTASKKVNTAGTDENLFRLVSVLERNARVLPLEPAVSVPGAHICARSPTKGYVQTGAQAPSLNGALFALEPQTVRLLWHTTHDMVSPNRKTPLSWEPAEAASWPSRKEHQRLLLRSQNTHLIGKITVYKHTFCYSNVPTTGTKELSVSTANRTLVCALISIRDVSEIFAITDPEGNS